jgi:hypothetical protein
MVLELFEEVDMCQFTTPTTCYSSPQRGRRQRPRKAATTTTITKTIEDPQQPRHDDDNEHQQQHVLEEQPTDIFQLATENHIIQVSVAAGENALDVSARTIPRETTSIICVGHSQDDWCPDLQAIAVLDPIRVPPQQQMQQPPWPPMVIYGPPEVYNNPQGGGGGDDVGSVLSTAQYTISDVSTVRNSNININTTPNTNSTSNNNNSPHPAVLRRSSSVGVSASPLLAIPPVPGQQQQQQQISSMANSASTLSVELIGGDNTAMTVQQQQQQIIRSPSSGSLASLAVAANINITGGATSGATNNAASAAVLGSSSTTMTMSNTHQMARIILQVAPRSEFVAHVDFSPLAPCVARFTTSGNPTTQVAEPSLPQGNTTATNTIGVTKNTIRNGPIPPTGSSSSSSHHLEDVGVWVGSSNDAHLRLFVPSTADHRLVLHSLASYPEFSMSTPVMALDYFCHDTDTGSPPGACKSTLAVACQDGTVRIITWEQGRTFANLRATTVIVDGPIVTLHVSFLDGDCQSRTTLPTIVSGDGKTKQWYRPRRLQVVVGSLCGYVCSMVEKLPEEEEKESSGEEKYEKGSDRTVMSTASHPRWEGPFMVVQGFWNHALEAEDSVLAVHVIVDHQLVAIGTHAGRCLLYREERSDSGENASQSSSYIKVWECTLPYSVHGIVAIPTTTSTSPRGDPRHTTGGASSLYLLVTTRRSIHLFQQQHSLPYHRNLKLVPSKTENKPLVTVPEFPPRNKTIVHSASAAKTKLLELIQKQQQQQQKAEDSQPPQLPLEETLEQNCEDDCNPGEQDGEADSDVVQPPQPPLLEETEEQKVEAGIHVLTTPHPPLDDTDAQNDEANTIPAQEENGEDDTKNRSLEGSSNGTPLLSPGLRRLHSKEEAVVDDKTSFGL